MLCCQALETSLSRFFRRQSFDRGSPKTSSLSHILIDVISTAAAAACHVPSPTPYSRRHRWESDSEISFKPSFIVFYKSISHSQYVCGFRMQSFHSLVSLIASSPFWSRIVMWVSRAPRVCVLSCRPASRITSLTQWWYDNRKSLSTISIEQWEIFDFWLICSQ